MGTVGSTNCVANRSSRVSQAHLSALFTQSSGERAGREQAAEIEDSNAELPWNFTVPLPLQNAPRIQSAISMFYESVKRRVQEAGVLGFTCNGGESVAWVKHTQCPESVVL